MLSYVYINTKKIKIKILKLNIGNHDEVKFDIKFIEEIDYR